MSSGHASLSMEIAFKCMALMAAALLILMPTSPLRAADLDAFWEQPRKGANSFNGAPPDEAYYHALADTGATWVRLAFQQVAFGPARLPVG